MKTIYKYFTLGILGIVMSSCNNGKSLQQYFVDSSNNPEFITFDVSSNILSIAEDELTPNQKETLHSIKKLNVLALKLDDSNESFYKEEKEKIKNILSSDSYQEIMRFNTGNARGVVKFLGEDDAIDEVILYGSDDSKGFALLRILGDNMNVENVGQLVEVIQKGTLDQSQLGSIGKIFSEVK
ncbi:DUF4252 domain-containing protein [Zhouia amylolytica]|uniref:DUF4252 domain-containing protein n=1 Tax=Zhouia amylolytica AD3 TaxID=1286632 RepID=W2URJ4_9FLAO|nr:DUF4252 domain-containing protein [Zhouia amylolytica]ETN95937.1 hypothetical protein P278_16590 [Zhouia amylolytica AD3]